MANSSIIPNSRFSIIGQNAYKIIFLFIVSSCLVLIDNSLSYLFGTLSNPIGYDGIVYIRRSSMIFNDCQNELGYFLGCFFRTKDPLWMILLYPTFSFNYLENPGIMFLVRIFQIFILTSGVFFLIRKLFNERFAWYAVVILSFTPLVSPSLRSVFSNDIRIWYQLNGLNDLKPDILWGSLMILILCSTLILTKKIEKHPKIICLFFSILSSFLVLSKGTTSPISLVVIFFCLLYVIFNSDGILRTKRYYLIMLTLGVLPFVAILIFWYLNGGLEEIIDYKIRNRQRTIYNDDQSYFKRLATWFGYIDLHLGVPETVLSTIAVVFGVIRYRYLTFIEKNAVFLILSCGIFTVLIISAANNNNTYASNPVSLCFFVSAIILFFSAIKSYNNNLLIIILLFIYLPVVSFSFFSIRELKTDHLNGLINLEVDNQKNYTELVKTINYYLDNNSTLFHHMRIFSGVTSINFYGNKDYNPYEPSDKVDTDTWVDLILQNCDGIILQDKDEPFLSVSINETRVDKFAGLVNSIDTSSKFIKVFSTRFEKRRNVATLFSDAKSFEGKVNFYIRKEKYDAIRKEESRIDSIRIQFEKFGKSYYYKGEIDSLLTFEEPLEIRFCLESNDEKNNKYNRFYPEMPMRNDLFVIYDLGDKFKMKVNKEYINIDKDSNGCTPIKVILFPAKNEIHIKTNGGIEIINHKLDQHPILGNIYFGTGFRSRHWSGNLKYFYIVQYPDSKFDTDEFSDYQLLLTDNIKYSFINDLSSDNPLLKKILIDDNN